MLRITLLSVLIIGLATVVGFVTIANSASAPSVDFIVAALQNQMESRGEGLEVSYTWAKSGQPGTQLNIRYVWTPTLKFLSLNEEAPERCFASVYDSRKSEYRSFRRTSTSMVGVISSVPEEVLSNQFTIDPIVRPLDDATLAEVVARGTVSPTPDSVEGHACWRVESSARTHGTNRYVIWVDPAIGFAPRKIETHGSFDPVPKTRIFSSYRELSTGTWFPMKVTATLEIPKTATEPAYMATFVCEVSEAIANVAVASDRVKVTFPSGTEVRDDVLGAQYTVP